MTNIQLKRVLTVLLIFVSSGLYAQEEAQRAFNEGVRLLRINKPIEAEQQFSIALSKGFTQSGLKMANIYKGFSLNAQGKYDSAISCFNKAIALDSLDLASYIDRGKTYGFKKDYENAIKDFEYVLKLDSNGEQAKGALYYLGKIKMITFKNEEAIQYFDSLIAISPDDAEAYFLRGTAKSNIMDSDGAIEDFDWAIKLRPNYMEAYANRGVQKINKVPVEEKIKLDIECLDEPCKDLLKAQELGDTTVADMIFLYCKNCK